MSEKLCYLCGKPLDIDAPGTILYPVKVEPIDFVSFTPEAKPKKRAPTGTAWTAYYVHKACVEEEEMDGR